MTTLKPAFAESLRSHRTRLNISQETLARILGVSLSAISNWERGIAQPSGLTMAGAFARLTQYQPGDPRLLPNHLRDRGGEVEA